MNVDFVAVPTRAVDLLPSGWRQFSLGAWTIGVGSDTPVAFQDSELIVLGEIFDQSGAMAATGTFAGGCLETGFPPAGLWGRYIAMSPSRDGIRIYREPSGAIASFCRPGDDLPLAFSNPDTVCASGLLAPRVNWQGLVHSLFYPQLPTMRTGWEGVIECLPGQMVDLGRSIRSETRWTPWDHVHDQGCQPSDTNAELRRLLLTCTAALVCTHPSVLLELSGGLDSSILAACLASSGTAWSAANLFTPGRDGDERAYARAVASRWHAPLQEACLAPSAVELFAAPRFNRVLPTGLSALACVDPIQEAMVARSGATALMSGTGGDNVFCALSSAAPLLDAVRTKGWLAGFAAARDLADISSTSLWAAASAARRYRRQDRSAPVRWQTSSLFLDPAARPPLEPHPWLVGPEDRLPGKRAHIVLILRAHSVAGALDRARSHDMLFPILAQPVLEMCLGIPSWRWIAGGCDRAVARDAFKELLPELVLARRRKGRLESSLTPAFAAQRMPIRELLLDGRLAGHGLLDRGAIERITTGEATTDDPRFGAAMRLIEAELWLATLGTVRRRSHAPPPIDSAGIGGIDHGLTR